MAKGCPSCGCLEYTKVKTSLTSKLNPAPRICAECRKQYSVPPPWWVGLIAYAMAMLLVAAMLIDMFAPPRDWPMHFTWRGRLGVIALAGAIVYAGTLVIRGKA